MYRVNTPSAAGSLPAPIDIGAEGYFTEGNPNTATPATEFGQDWCNAVQEELVSFLTAAGITRTRGVYNQCLTAVFQLIAGGYLSATRIRLTGPTTFYVVPSGGSNGNSGLDSAHPWATLQKAVNVLQNNYDLNGQTVTIDCYSGLGGTAGTYSAGANIAGPWVGNGTVIFQGNTAGGHMDDTVVSVTGANNNCFTTAQASIQVSSMKLVSAAASALFAQQSGVIGFSNVDFGACGINHKTTYSGGVIANLGAYKITGNAVAHDFVNGPGNIAYGPYTVTLTGTPAFSTTFADVLGPGFLDGSQAVFSGAATTPNNSRYAAALNGVIYTNGGGANFFPGTGTGGSTSTGGQYN